MIQWHRWVTFCNILAFYLSRRVGISDDVSDRSFHSTGLVKSTLNSNPSDKPVCTMWRGQGPDAMHPGLPPGHVGPDLPCFRHSFPVDQPKKPLGRKMNPHPVWQRCAGVNKFTRPPVHSSSGLLLPNSLARAVGTLDSYPRVMSRGSCIPSLPSRPTNFNKSYLLACFTALSLGFENHAQFTRRRILESILVIQLEPGFVCE